MKQELTQARLIELLTYDPEEGILRWRSDMRGSGRKAGEAAGCLHMHSNGKGGNCSDRPLILVGVDYKIYRAHRLVWLYVHGEIPKGRVDHIDGDPTNNRIANLRVVSSQVNSQNMRKAQPYNRTGMLGVGVDKERGCFKSEIRLANGKRKFLGRFSTPEAAHAAYIAAKRIYHEGCTI